VCGLCKTPGHNGRSCSLRRELCGECRQPGHRRGTCPTLGSQRAAREREEAFNAGRDAVPTALHCPKRWSPEFDRGYVEGSDGEIPPHHTPWKLFPTGQTERDEVAPGAYDAALDGKIKA
jgi:hypothetical protein